MDLDTGQGVEQYSPRMANKTIPKAGRDINLGCLESRLEKQEATVEECSPGRERERGRGCWDRRPSMLPSAGVTSPIADPHNYKITACFILIN